MREAAFEKYVCDKIRQCGGRAFKWICPGLSGAPDRIVVLPVGRIIFMELKRPGVKDGMSARQKKVCRVLENLGCAVYLISDKEDFRKMMEDFDYEI